MPNDITSISDTLLKARRNRESHAGFPTNLPKTLNDAYAVQGRSREMWGDKVVAWKVGGIPPHRQDEFGASRLVGPIFEKSVKHCADGETIDIPSYPGGFVAIEPEYVITLAGVDALPEGDITLDDLPKIVTRAYIGIEIASSPIQTINDIGPLAIVSDFGNNAGLVIGPEVPDILDLDFAQHNVTTHIDGVLVGECPAKNGEAGALGAVLFLVNHLRRNGIAIPDGTMVSTGAITGVHDTKIGTTSIIKFDGFGTMTVKLTAYT